MSVSAAAPTSPLPIGLDDGPRTLLSPGAWLGRYVVTKHVGSGSGGDVYAGFDSQLDRDVALKVLPAVVSPEGDTRLSTALVAEAQLIATLNHPHIVTIHDIGQAHGHTYIAMELVSGGDMGEWLRRHPAGTTPWRQRLEPWLPVGQALAAAHQAGVIHGDLKPANVLRTPDGQIRVSDFGVGRFVADEANLHRVTQKSRAIENPTSTQLWGTPNYMAPELFDGRPPDERSDLYAFCAAVFEALYGHVPATGPTREKLVTAKHRRIEPNTKHGVPRAILDILRQGLHPDPSRRPTLHELLDRLTRRMARRRHIAYTAAGLALVGLALTPMAFLGQPQRPCRDSAERLADVWDGANRQAIESVFQQSGRAYAAATWEYFSTQLDDYSKEWIDTHRDTCLASARGEQSDALLSIRMGCLDKRRLALKTLVQLVQTKSLDDISKPTQAAESLPPIGECRDLLQPSDHPLPPIEVAQEVAAIDAEIITMQTELDLLSGSELTAQARRVVERAEATGHDPVIGRAYWTLGRAASASGDFEKPIEWFEKASLLAAESGDDRTAALAGLSVMTSAKSRLDTRTANSWAPHIQAALKRARAEPKDWAAFHYVRYKTLLAHGQNDEAASALEKAIEQWRLVPGDLARARRLEAEAGIHALRGDLPTAVSKQRQATNELEATFGWPNPTLLVAMNELAHYLVQIGDHQAAVTVMTRLVEGAVSKWGADGSNTVGARMNLALALSKLNRFPEAIDQLSTARDIFIKTGKTTDPYYAAMLSNLAGILNHAERYEEALPVAQEALPLHIEHFGPEHPFTGYAYLNLGSARANTGSADKAVDLLERALDILTKSQQPSDVIANCHFALAQALVKTKQDRDRAVKLAQSARKAWHELGDHERVADVTQWLDSVRDTGTL